jgi:transmembrane sensor
MQVKFNVTHQIARLVSKHVAGTANDADQSELKEWLDQSDKHREMYDEWMKQLSKDLRTAQPADAKKAWRKFYRMQHPMAARWLRPAYYAAAAVVVVVIALAGYMYFGGHTTDKMDMPIVAGSPKTLLLTETGDKVQVLPTIQVVKTNNEKEIFNQNGILRYDMIPEQVKEQFTSDVYHTLQVPRGGEYQVVLSDGTHIHLNAESAIKFPVVFVPGDKVRKVSVVGEAYFEVAHNDQVPFEVQTSHGTVRVYGTKFNVRDYADEASTSVTLAEGSVSYIIDGKEYMLKPGMQSDYRNHQVSLHEVDITSYTSWATGTFEFNSMTLQEIMSRLSRWYDVDYQFTSPALKNSVFTGVAFRNAPLENILKQIEITTQIHFTIKNRTIIISQ